MKKISLSFAPRDRPAARRIRSELQKLKLGRKLRDAYGLARPARLFDIRLTTSTVPALGDLCIVLLSARPENLEQQESNFRDLVAAGSTVLPILFEKRKFRSEPAERRIIDLLDRHDLLAIDLAEDADGWRTGMLKIAARSLEIPFNVIRDREAERERKRIRFNLFATVGLLAILTVSVTLSRLASWSQDAALNNLGGCLFFSHTNMVDLQRYALAPGPAAPAAIDAMRKNLARAEIYTSLLADHPSLGKATSTVAVIEHIMVAQALYSRSQFDQALQILIEAKAKAAASGLDAASSVEGLLASTLQFDPDFHLAMTYYLAGEYGEALPRYLSLAEQTRTAFPEPRIRCARLVEALSGVAFTKLRMASSEGGWTWPSAELEEGRQCISQIEETSTDPLPFPAIRVEQENPANERELRAVLKAVVETTALAFARATQDETIIATQRKRAENTVIELEQELMHPVDWARRQQFSAAELDQEKLAEEISRLRQNVVDAPHISSHQTELVYRLQILASRQAASRDSKSLRTSGEAEVILKELIRLDPTNLDYSTRLELLLASRADDMARLGKCEEARAASEESIRILTSLVESQRLNARWQRDLQVLRTAKPCKE
jgi:tetratricopeptide (TPR) repeat protein